MVNVAYKEKNAMNRDKQNRICNLDVLKAISAFLIIHIHYPSCILSEYVDSVARVAVPLFAMISGYFYRKNQSVIKPILKISLILVVAEIVNGFACGFDFYISQLRANGIKNAILCHFAGWTPGWFLLALIYAYIFIWLIDKIGIRKICYYVLVPVLLIFLWIGQRLCSIYFFSDIYYYTFCIRIIPFFIIGNYINEHEDALKSIPSKVWAVVASFGVVLTVSERWLMTSILGHPELFFLYLGTFVAIIAAFGLALGCDEWNFPLLKFIGKNLSMYIYVVHMAIICVCRNHGYVFDSLWICLGSFIVSLIFYFIFYYAKHIVVNH